MSRAARSLSLVVVAVASFACGGATPEAATAQATPSDGAPAAAPAAPAPAAASARPTVTLNGIAVSAKDDHFTRVTVTFRNPGGVPCKITNYTLTWPGGTKTFPLDNFILGPGGEQVRAMRLHESDGNIHGLIDPKEAHVELESDCK
ncbi:MAG TPA: hypothetical protein VGM56_23590 [Byssovorax sp.]|jgi:hypothetical protein